VETVDMVAEMKDGNFEVREEEGAITLWK